MEFTNRREDPAQNPLFRILRFIFRSIKRAAIFLGVFLVYHIIFSNFFPVDETNTLVAPGWYMWLGVLLAAAVAFVDKIRMLIFKRTKRPTKREPKPDSEITPTKKADIGEKKKIYKRSWFWAIIVILVIICVAGKNTGNNPIAETESATEDETEIVIELSEKEQFAADFCEESGLSEDCANSLYDFLYTDLGAQNIKFVGKNAVGSINWDISTTNYRLMATADEDGIYRIVCGDYTLFDGESIKYTCDDLAQRDVSDNRSAYVVIAQEIISGVLKAPSTAEFQSSLEMLVARNGNLVAVQGYVDSQNGFGAMIRSDFIAEFIVLDINSFSYETQYIRIGDEEVGEYIDLE